MAIWSIFKVSRKTFFNPAGWIDIESLKAQNQTIFNSVRDLFVVPKPDREETFDQAITRLGLKKEEIHVSYRRYRFYALLFLILSIISFFYACYLLFAYFSLSGLLLGLAVTALFLSQAFRYDFWAYQIKHRKLGVSFAEWKNNLLGIKGSKS